MSTLPELKIRIFADGADKAGILELYRQPYIHGLTTNPSLMKRAGIRDYEAFARDILATVTAKPISLEVLSDDFPDMRRQALKIAGWADNVYVKIPVTNSRGESSAPLIRDLASRGVRVNVTAVVSPDQVREVAQALNPAVPSVVSIIAGRIADTGKDPMPVVRECVGLLRNLPKSELLWASVREVYNLVQAAECGCSIVTVPHEILAKAAKFLGRNLPYMSLDTVRGFVADATSAGFTL